MGSAGRDGSLTAEKSILVKDKVLLKPAWVQGVRVHAWAPDSRSIIFIENMQGSTLLKQVSLETTEITTINLQPYTNVSQISMSPNGKIALLAQSATIPPRLITVSDGKVEIIARSQSESIAPMTCQSRNSSTGKLPMACKSLASTTHPQTAISVHKVYRLLWCTSTADRPPR